MAELSEEKSNLSLQGKSLPRPNRNRDYDYHAIEKEGDSTMFSIREGARKADNHRQDNNFPSQNYLRNKRTTNEVSNNSSNQSSLIGIDKYSHHTDSSHNNPTVIPLRKQGTQNASELGSKSSIPGNSKRGKDETEDSELQSNYNHLEKNVNNAGDDEPIFPTIINKRDAYKNENNSFNDISQTSGSIKPLNFGKIAGGLNAKIELYNMDDSTYKNYKNPVMLETNHPIMNVDYLAMKQYVKEQEISSNLLNKKTKALRGASEDMKHRKNRKNSHNGRFGAQKVNKTKNKDSSQKLKQLGMYLDNTPKNTELNNTSGIEIVDKQLEKYSNKTPMSYGDRNNSKNSYKRPQVMKLFILILKLYLGSFSSTHFKRK